MCSDAHGATTEAAAAAGLDWGALLNAILGLATALGTLWAVISKKKATTAGKVLSVLTAVIEPRKDLHPVVKTAAINAGVQENLRAHLVGQGLSKK